MTMLLPACREPASTTEGQDYWPDTSWRRASPSEAGVDSARLQSVVQAIQTNAVADFSSLVVIRYGYLVQESYFNGSGPNDVHTMQSVSKSVTSLVTGIAVDQGLLAPPVNLFAILPEYAPLATDPRKAAITIGDLLAMRAGINFYEYPYPGSPLEQLNTSTGDWVNVALSPPMNAAPGAQWQYNSGGVIVLASAVRRAAGAPFQDFARQNLFTRIGITTERWYASPYDALPHAGGGLSLKALDLARIGYLVLRRGKWNDEQVVSEAWLDAALTPRTTGLQQFGPDYPVDYGYLWWLLPIDSRRSTSDVNNVIYTGSGNMMQWLFVVPRYDLVVVVTGRGNTNFIAPLDFLYNDILPAMR